MGLRAWKPSASRSVLFGIAGVMWAGVGVMLLVYAVRWIAGAGWGRAWPFGVVALAGAAVVARFGFSRIVRKNRARIAAGPERACLFSFQAWRSYVLILVMVALGIGLKHSPLPRTWLAVVYGTIGGALLACSALYCRRPA